ncbi:4Fe-4S dicluster domain-containing protein [Treponema sp.]|uniref:4Fe-4S dicluster domain-containing protein n=1 Tax=Treponema sp. TaxID=166 RepID=UPI00388DC805
MQQIEKELIEKAEKLLADGTVEKIIGWKKGLFEEDIAPAVFESVEELKKDFVYDERYCGNLVKFLMRHKTHKVGIFLRPKFVLSYNQLLKEHRINADEVAIIELPESEKDKEEKQKRFEEVEKLEKMSADQRYEFWKKEFSRCIRCNACRDICPACTCEKCVFDNNKLYTSQKVAQTSFEESLYHIIRAWHVAGRCTDCGECSRVCPEHIPLYLLNRKYIKDINEIYGEYQAGSDMETKPPMLTFKEDDAEPSVVFERSSDGGDE